MKRRIACTISSVLLALPLITSMASARKTARVQLLETGEFHADEVKARTGERWLGLFPTRNGFSLLSATITVNQVHDPVVDQDGIKNTGKKVSVTGRPEPVFLLKEDPNMLRRGPVVTVFRESRSLGNGAMITLKLGIKEYQLKVISSNPEPTNFLAQDTKLLLTFEKKSQVLLHLKEHDDAGWSLFWAGDLDRDGKLDLYVDLSNHYNVTRRVLLLSSEANPRELVSSVATFTTVGC